jgi:hypothetical protein
MSSLITEKRGRKRLLAVFDESAPAPSRRESAIPTSIEHSVLIQQSQKKINYLTEWKSMVHSADTMHLLTRGAKKNELIEALKRAENTLQRCTGKRWLVSTAHAATHEAKKLRDRLQFLSCTPLSLVSPSVLASYEVALKNLPVSSSTEPSGGGAKAVSRSSARSNVILVTPENAALSLTLHLQSRLKNTAPPLLLTLGDICDECGVQMHIIANASMLGCTACHKTRLLPNTTVVEVSSAGEFDYISKSHQKHRLTEWLEMAQAKQFAEPPSDVLETIATYLAKKGTMDFTEEEMIILRDERISGGPYESANSAVARLENKIPHVRASMLKVQSGVVRRTLQSSVHDDGQTRLRKYYEHSAKCASYLSGFWPVRMNAQQEEVLRLMYSFAAPAYDLRQRPKQHYWPGGFPYFLRSTCCLLGWDEFVPLFPLPPGSHEGGCRHKLRKSIWESNLKWEVVPAFAPLPPIQIRVKGENRYEMFQLLEDDGINSTTATGGAITPTAKKIKAKKRVYLDNEDDDGDDE